MAQSRASTKNLRNTLIACCRELPGATEDVKWGADLAFSIGGKMFAVFANDSPSPQFSCKVTEEDFAALTSIEGIIPAPYAARYHWIRVEAPEVLPTIELATLLEGSYALVKAKLPAKVRARFTTVAEAPRPADDARASKTKAAPRSRPSAPKAAKKKLTSSPRKRG